MPKKNLEMIKKNCINKCYIKVVLLSSYVVFYILTQKKLF